MAVPSDLDDSLSPCRLELQDIQDKITGSFHSKRDRTPGIELPQNEDAGGRSDTEASFDSAQRTYRAR
jgi:hypothetical protein